jgi:DNA-binding protein H-NS
MKDVEIDKLTTKELKELLATVDLAIASRQADDRANLKERFREMAEEAGLSLSDIVGGGGRTGKGRVVAAKFANPENPSETWSGRGRQPNWLSAKLKSGAKLEDFRLD